MHRRLALLAAVLLVAAACGGGSSSPPPEASSGAVAPESSGSEAGVRLVVTEYDVEPGSHPHDVAPAVDGGIWYTGQRDGTLGHLDPGTGEVTTVGLSSDSAPHGVVTGPDGKAYITDGGQNAIVKYDPALDDTTVYLLPTGDENVNLNTAAFDPDGVLWFTGQGGIYGWLRPETSEVGIFEDPDGRGPYGITSTPGGQVWYASLAGSHIAQASPNGRPTIVEPPTPDQGARRIWSDSTGRLWVSEWNAGQVAVHDPADGSWKEWRLPGENPQPYAVFVDDRDIVWLTDFGSNAIVRFDPETEAFTSVELPTPGAAVRQLHGRPGEVWGAESATDKLVRITEE